jgi:PAS domain S-box-containing protein
MGGGEFMPATEVPYPLSDTADALARIDDVLRLARSMIWEIDRDGIFTYVSPSFETVLGYRPEEVVGIRSIHDFYPPDLPASLGAEIDPGWVTEGREFTNSEVPLLSKSGETVWVAADGKPIFDGAGNLIGFRGADTDITARKQLEDRLASRESQLMNLIISAPVAMAYTSVDGHGEMIINKAFEELFGYTAQDIPKMADWFCLAYPDESYRQEVKRRTAELMAVINAGRPAPGPQDYRIAHKDGRLLDVEIDAAIVGGFFVGTFVDITARQRTLDDARAAQSELRAALDNLPFPVAISSAGPDFDWTDARAEISYLNDSFTALFGYELADIPKAADFARAAFPDEGRRTSTMAALEAQVQRALAGEPDAVPLEVRAVAKDGRELEVLFKAVAVRGGVVVSFQDLTQRNQSERFLRASEQTLRSLFEEAPLGIVRMDIASQKLWVNKAFTDTLGYTSEDIPTFEDWLHLAYPEADCRQLIRAEWAKDSRNAARRGGKLRDADVTVVAKDGRRHEMNFSGVIVGNEVFGMWSDLTERNRAERLLREQSDQISHAGRVSALGQLAASLAHELDQPLGAILNNAETARLLLARKKPQIADLREIVADIVEDDRRAGEVLDRIRAMLQKHSFRPDAVDVPALFGNILKLVRPLAEKKSIKLEISCEPGLRQVEGDHVLLQQALLNLVLNSIEAIGARGRGIISLRAGAAEDSRVGISVNDNGGGVPPERVAHLVQPFHTSKEGGLGMGLAIVNSIIEQHGGTMRIDNQPSRSFAVALHLPAWHGPARH